MSETTTRMQRRAVASWLTLTIAALSSSGGCSVAGGVAGADVSAGGGGCGVFGCSTPDSARIDRGDRGCVSISSINSASVFTFLADLRPGCSPRMRDTGLCRSSKSIGEAGSEDSLAM